MGSKSTPKAPDLTSLSNAQLQISQQQLAVAQQQMQMSNDQFNKFMNLSDEQLQESKDQYAQQMQLQQKALDQADAANAISKSVADQQIAAMQQNMGFAQQDRDRYTNTILPLQDQYIQEAKDYNTPEKQEQMAGQAMADNQNALEAQRANTQASLVAMGVDPSQIMSTSLSTQLGVGGAAQSAMLANQARNQVIQTGYDMLGNAINMGNNLPAQATNSANTAVNAGNSAANAVNSSTNNYASASGIGATASGIRQNALNTASAVTGSPTSWAQLGSQSYGGASNGIMNASSIQNQMFQNQMSVQNMKDQQSQQFMNNVGTVASIAGMAMMAEGGEINADAISQGAMQFDPYSLDVSDLAPAHAGLAQASAALSGPTAVQSWGSAMAKGAGALGGGGKSTPDAFASDPNMHRNWLSPVMYKAEGGAANDGAMAGNGPAMSQMESRPSAMHRGALPAMQARDKIHAMLAPGEYVIPADVVHQLGVNHFDKLVDKFHRPGA